MKKTRKKLIVASLALVITLALTATSTFAWFNMQSTAEVSFNLQITSDTGFEVAVVPYEYYGTDNDPYAATGITRKVPLAAPTLDAKYTPGDDDFAAAMAAINANFKLFLNVGDFNGLFTKKVLNAATPVRKDGENNTDPAAALDFKTISPADGSLLAIQPSYPTTETDILDVPYYKFRIFIRSTQDRTVYVKTGNNYNTVSIDKGEDSGNVENEKVVKEYGAVKALINYLDTAGAATFNFAAWESTSIEDEIDADANSRVDDNTVKKTYTVTAGSPGASVFPATIEIHKYNAATDAVTGFTYSVETEVKIESTDFTKAFRVAFEGFDTKTSAALGRIIVDKGDSDTDGDERTAGGVKNLGWIYWNFNNVPFSATTFAAYKFPIGNEGTLTNSKQSPAAVIGGTALTDGYKYSYVDVTVWLEGYDQECFDSILGLEGFFKFGLTSVAPV